MKNLHLISTDKPSRLGYLTKKGKEVFNDLRLFEKPMPNILDSENQNIYITSDEEIKEGDWTFDGENPYKWTEDDVEDCYNPGFENYKGCKKIILTTDQDLIKDGVQAIDDEFLEWFVKSPRCEVIEVKKEYITPLGDFVETCYDDERLNYKIIIPKEEPKQESPEEAAARYTCGWGENDDEKAFIAGAKWQQKRMYSEEDMRTAYNQGIDDSFDIGFSSKDDTNFNSFIEQFKNK